MADPRTPCEELGFVNLAGHRGTTHSVAMKKINGFTDLCHADGAILVCQ